MHLLSASHGAPGVDVGSLLAIRVGNRLIFHAKARGRGGEA